MQANIDFITTLMLAALATIWGGIVLFRRNSIVRIATNDDHPAPRILGFAYINICHLGKRDYPSQKFEDLGSLFNHGSP